MNQKIYELSNGKVLGMGIVEIVSIPSITIEGKNNRERCEENMSAFSHIISELYHLSSLPTCFEFLWVTEETSNQAFMSKVHIYCIVRNMGERRTEVVASLESILNDVRLSLSSLQYSLQEVEIEQQEFQDVIGRVNTQAMFSIVKKEKCNMNSNSAYPYYYCDVVQGKTQDNFNSLVDVLCQNKNCCLSFQLFPSRFTQEERVVMNEACSELGKLTTGVLVNGQIYKDIAAGEPQKVYSYYNARKDSPIFLYNVLTFGERNCCTALAAKVISLLQSGQDNSGTADFVCLDLSKENINLSKQLPQYVWNVNSKLMYSYRNTQLLNMVPLAKVMFRMPYMMSVDEAVTMFRLPLHEKSMIALKNNQEGRVLEQFSKAVVDVDNIQLGTLNTGDETKIMIGCSEKAFTKHALIVGTSSSGKTTFSMNLLLQFNKRKIPFLVIEPTKTEYRAMIDAIPDIQIFTPGKSFVSPFIINPFIPPKGISVEQYVPSLASAFKAAFSMPSPLDMIFLKAIRVAYTRYGWKDYSTYEDEDVTIFGLYEFILVFKNLMKNMDYSKDVRSNIESAGLLRLMNLIEQNSNIYDSIHTVPIEDILTAPTIIELNSIDNAEQKSLIMALLLINVCVYTKHNHINDGKLQNVILIDEAHVILDNGGTPSSTEGGAESKTTTIKTLQNMIVEIRSYGTSIIIADQAPTKVSREIIANTDIKVAFRLLENLEKKLIADTTNMEDIMQKKLAQLKIGQAYTFFGDLNTPQMIITEDIREREGIRLSVSDSEVAERSMYWNERQVLLKPYRECKYCDLCDKKCDFKVRSNAEYIAERTFDKYRSSITSADTFKKCIFYLPVLMAEEFQKYENYDVQKLMICSRIKLMRKIVLELSVNMNEEDKIKVLTCFPQDERNEDVVEE